MNKDADDTAKDRLMSSNGDASGAHMKRDVGLIGGVAVIVGTMIGSGIFASPKFVLMFSGSVGMALVIWTLCGVLAMCGALSYAELGTMIPTSGGESTYLLEAFGGLPSFMYIWTACIVIKPSQIAIVCLVFGEYVVTPFFPNCAGNPDVQVIIKLLAAFAIAVITIINCISVKLATRVMVFFTAAKLLALVMIIITGLVRLGQGYNYEVESSRSFDGTVVAIGSIGEAFYNGLWAYDGWNNLNYITEEIKKPERNLPLAIAIGIPLVTGIYLLTNISYFTVLSKKEVWDSSAVGVIFAQRMFGVMYWIIPVFVACSTFGAANGAALASGRLLYAAARHGHLPKLLAMIHNTRGVPIPGLILQSLIAWAMLIPESSSFATLIGYFTFAAWVFYGSTIAGLLYMKFFSRRNEHRPFKVFVLFPLIVLLAAIYLIIAPFSKTPLPAFFCLLFILCGIPMYFLFIYTKKSPACLSRGLEKFTYFVQKFADVSYPSSEDAIIG